MNTTTLKPQLNRMWVEVVPDETPDTSYLEQDGFEDDLAAYNAGEFNYVGIRACAEISFETPQGGWTGLNVITSPGLWGIETRSDQDYLDSIGEEEKEELWEMLEALGISREDASAV